MIGDLRAAARALGGVVAGRHAILAPAPGHDARDRGMSITVSSGSPDGFLVHLFNGSREDAIAARDHVRQRLGLPLFSSGRERPREAPRRPDVKPEPANDDEKRIALACRIWAEALDPVGTKVERYLRSRGLDLPQDVAGRVLRFHPRTAFRDADGHLAYGPAMIAAMRDIRSDRLVAIQRTFLRPDGTKIDRRMLGRAGGTAIKLDADEDVHGGLVAGEGCETVLAARQLGYRPAWALGSVGALAAFSLLSGIEAITLLEETGEASAKAVQECGTRWHAAAREVRIVRPRAGSDINDALREIAA